MAEIKDINKSPGVQQTHHVYHHPGSMPDVSSKSLQLTGILQSTLELNKILELFDAEVSSIVPHDGLGYSNPDADCLIHFGTESRHRCTYDLVLLDKTMGELSFSRATRFTDNEIKQLETLIAALIYPLRNALLYKRAVATAHRDPVTGVNNRAALDSALGQEINLARRHAAALSMIMVDIDRFKQINDTYGHIAGDAILKCVAEAMVDCVRGSDTIYRYGGEEFVILLRNTRKPGARLLAERIRASIENMHYRYQDFDIQITVSAGLTAFRKNDTTVSFLERCDAALYEAKHSGRNCVVVAET